MKKLLILLISILFIQGYAIALTGKVTENVTVNNSKVFSQDNLFGLKKDNGDIIIEPIYKKMIRLGEHSFLVQKKSKFGLIDYNGDILVPIKYTHAERILGKYLKIGNGNKYALYNEYGTELLPREYSSIDLMFGDMFLTRKNFKYGIIDTKGRTILGNEFDDIYMPKPNILRINHAGQWYEIEQVRGEKFTLPQDIQNIKGDENFKISELITKPGTATGYSVVTFTDYLLKLFSSISPAHEQTIDELMLSQGAETVSIFIKLTWLPKYPFTYARNYFNTVRTPNNGPLSDVKYDLKRQLQ